MFRACIFIMAIVSVNDWLESLAAAPPRFTEEREAAALFFVKKQCPDLLPYLEELNKNNHAQYELQIRDIFEVTEMLAHLEDDRRHDLELKIWKTEARCMITMHRFASTKEDEKPALEGQLKEFAKELVELEVQSLEMHTELLEKELSSAKEELNRTKDNFDKMAKDRFEEMLEKARRKKKM